jgi:5-methylcytosine-specific restriction endonuclease McrA
MSKVLLLAGDYTPLKTVSVERAFTLMALNKVDVIIESEAVYRSPSTEMRVPSVIRYKRFVRRQRVKLRLNKRNLFLRDGHRGCAYCGTELKLDSFTLDHVLPRKLGGGNSWDNLVGCCKVCNQKKADKPLEKSGMHLRYPACEPPLHISILKKSYADELPEDWRPYFFH